MKYNFLPNGSGVSGLTGCCLITSGGAGPGIVSFSCTITISPGGGGEGGFK